MDTPLVSIVIPLYNASRYMREAIDSALAQTYPNIEILVINDGSNDDGDTERIALSYGDRVRYFGKKENEGVSSVLNIGIREMRGDYFSWLSHDDLYHAQKIAAQIDHLRAFGRDDLVVYTDYEFIDGGGKTIREMRLPSVLPEKFRYFITATSDLNGCSLLIPKKCFDEIGFFDTAERITQDYRMWFRMAEKFEFHHLPRNLVKLRLHGDQVTVKLSDHMNPACDLLKYSFIEEMERTGIGLPDEHRGRIYATLALSMARHGYRRAFRYTARLALRHMGKQPVADLPISIAKVLFAIYKSLK
ncbi:MAG TPA: glycosyltransferase [bacterium]|nr:glycosyltransferase [bacterium]